VTDKYLFLRCKMLKEDNFTWFSWVITITLFPTLGQIRKSQTLFYQRGWCSIPGYQVRIASKLPAILTEVFYDFPQPLRECWCTYLLTPWSRILFEKLIVTQPVKKYPAFFMEPKGSLACSQKLATGPYPEPAESNSPRIPDIGTRWG
jgi:hypothetical protein